MFKKLTILLLILVSTLSVEVVSAQQYADRACLNDSRIYRVTGAQGSTFSWVVDGGALVNDWGDSIEIKWNTTGVFNLQAQQRSAQGCLSPPVYAQVLVTGPTMDLGKDLALCRGKSTVINADNGFASYQWNTGSNSQGIEVTSEGWYKVTAYDENGCEASDSLYVTMVSNPVVNLGIDTALCWNETVELDAGPDGDHYLWFDNSNSRTFIAYAGLSEVWVKVTNSWGCVSSDTMIVKECDYSKFSNEIPNTFTPNGDGKNDTWYIPWLYRLNSVRIDIYDRWGQVVYHSDNGLPATGWDGSRNGTKLPMDSYYYIIDLKNGSTPLRGTITIVR